jgi:hypothetical protein
VHLPDSGRALGGVERRCTGGALVVVLLLTVATNAHAAVPVQPVAPRGPNLLPNGGFELDDAPGVNFDRGMRAGVGWNTAGSTGVSGEVTLTRAWGGRSGDLSARLTNTATQARTCVLNDSPDGVAATNREAYTAALWVRADSDGQTLRLRLREYHRSTGSLLGSRSTPVTLTTSWQRVSVAYTPVAAGASRLDFTASVTDARPGTCFYADDASVDLPAAPASPYFVPSAGFDDPTLAAAPEFPNLYLIIARAGFDHAITGWNTSGSTPGVELVRDYQDPTWTSPYPDYWSVKLRNGSTNAGRCVLNDSPNIVATTEPGTYTALLWADILADEDPWGDDERRPLRVTIREYDKATRQLLGSQSTQVTALWPSGFKYRGLQPIAVTYTPLAPGASTLDLTASADAGPGEDCFTIDDVSVALSSTPSDPSVIAYADFETALSGWSTKGSGAGVELTRDHDAHSGDWAAKLTKPSNTGTCVLTDAPNIVATTEPGKYTATIWVRGWIDGFTTGEFRFGWHEYDNTTGARISETVGPTWEWKGAWRQFRVTIVPKAPGRSTLDLTASLSPYKNYSPSVSGCNGFRADDLVIRHTPM